jgi:hypothetical protein
MKRIRYGDPRQLSILTAIALIVASCKPPYVDHANTPLRGEQGQTVQITLSGNKFAITENPDHTFSSPAHLLIDGNLDGIDQQSRTPYAVSVSNQPFTFSSVQDQDGNEIDQLSGSLVIAADAPPGAYSISVGVPAGSGTSGGLPLGGVSNYKFFYVTCAGCPPAPELDEISMSMSTRYAELVARSTQFEPDPDASPAPIPDTTVPLIAGQSYELNFAGHAFDHNPMVEAISGSGLSFQQISNVTGTSFSVRADVAADASHGVHLVRVHTDSAPSEALRVKVAGSDAPAAPLIATGIAIIAPFGGNGGALGCPSTTAQNNIWVSYIPHGGDAPDLVDVRLPGNSPPLELDAHFAQDPIPGLVEAISGPLPKASLYYVALKDFSGYSNWIPLSCGGPENPVTLNAVTPSVIERGAVVRMACSGFNFDQTAAGADKHFIRRVHGYVDGQDVAANGFDPPTGASDPNTQIVAEIVSDPASTASSIKITVEDQNHIESNAIELAIDDSLIRYDYPLITQVLQGSGEVEVKPNLPRPYSIVVGGKKLQNATNIFFAFPGSEKLHVSNFNPHPSGYAPGTAVTFDLAPDLDAPLSADVPTNFFVTTTDGDTNLLGIHIFKCDVPYPSSSCP